MPTKIEIRGVIIPNDDKWIYDWFDVESTSPKQVAESIANANGDELEVIINSPGGDVYSGSEIYTMLKEYPGNSVSKIVGIAASAASFAALGTKRTLISPTGQMMIHNAATETRGDSRAHRHSADFLDTTNVAITNAYRLKTGMSQSELLDLMNRETFMNAQEALEKGFVDEIMFDEGGQLRAVASISSEMIPQKVIARMRNEFLKMKGEVNKLENQIQASTPSVPVSPAAAASAPAAPSQANTSFVADAAAQERARLKAIDAIAANIAPELVNEAKYGENPMSAEQLAFRAMQEGKLINSGVFESAVAANKAAGADNVQAQALQQNNEKEYDLNNLNDVNAIFSGIAAQSQAHRPQNIRRG